MKHYLFICFFVLSQTCLLKGQEPLKQGELNKVLNNAFSKLVSANPSGGEIASYASLDPVNANFSLKGTFPVQPGRKKRMAHLSFEQQLQNDPAHVSYLSFSLSGNLIDKSYASLFSNSSLNTGINFQAQYNFKVKTPHYSISEDEQADIALKRDQLFYTYHQALLSFEKAYSDSAYLKNDYLLKTQQQVNNSKMIKARAMLYLIQKAVDSLGVTIGDHPEMFDSLQKQVKAVASLKMAIDQTATAIDSAEMVHTNDLFFLKMNRELALLPQLEKNYDSTILLFTVKKIKITWFTLQAGFSRTSYTTYDAGLPFSAQIAKQNGDGLNGGVALNHLVQDKLKHHTLFLNISLSRLRTNNLSLLSTTAIDETKKEVNTAGDTTRVITNKYNAYTDPVIQYDTWDITGNLYYLFGKTPSGFHISPAFDFNQGRRSLLNFTAGYLISFQNTVKDQPVVNAEIFVKFNDVFNSTEAKSKFWNRNEIGVSFTIPFNIYN